MGEITIEINNDTVWCCRNTVKSNSFLCVISRFRAFNFPSRIWEVSRTLKFFPKKVKQWWVGSIHNTWKIRKRIEMALFKELMKYKGEHNTRFSLWKSISHVNRTFI